jgi:hypothetical protein
MSNLYWLTDQQMERLKPFFPRAMASPRIDDCSASLFKAVRKGRFRCELIKRNEIHVADDKRHR